ncbi:dysbindin-like [Huso huso]|uniref:Dysbindin-like n=1 Tax=Huso huso TaxID=61971 RepID=A0ABR0Z3P1_HUSHU
MSSSGSNSHNKNLPSETEHAQRVLELDHAQQLKLRERQRFFEEVFQHDVDVYLSAAHLQIEHKRPPIGSISSMEVNVDMLEQMDLLDISDQEAFDVFLNSGAEEGSIATALADDSDVYQDEITLQVPREAKSRTSSTSSTSTDPYSLDTSEEGAETPVVQSDDEDVQADTELLTAPPLPKEEDEDKPDHAS